MFPYLNCDRIEDRRWVEQQLSEEREKWIDDRAKEIIASFPANPAAFVALSIPADKKPYAGLSSDSAIEAYNDFVSAVADAQASHEWEHRTGCPF